MWTSEWEALIQSSTYKQRKAFVKPSQHYQVKEPEDDAGYCTLPTEPANSYKVLRHMWYMERKKGWTLFVLKGSNAKTF